MPNKNPYFIPKENLPKIAEVRYLKIEIPTYEEFMKTYEKDEKVSASCELEYQDQLSHDSQCGPGKKIKTSGAKKIKNKLSEGDFDGQHLIHTLNDNV